MTLQGANRLQGAQIWRAILGVWFCYCSLIIRAQDLAPRAYLIIPIHSNAVTLTYSFFGGELLFDGAVPITGATANVSLSVVSYTHSHLRNPQGEHAIRFRNGEVSGLFPAHYELGGFAERERG